YLKEEGIAGIILMSKFMNSKDGIHLKRFLLPYIKTIVTYPGGYFQEFKVTTSIVVLSKKQNDMVNFVRVLDKVILEDPIKIRQISEMKNDEINSSFTVRRVQKSLLKPDQNWLLYLIDPRQNSEKLS